MDKNNRLKHDLFSFRVFMRVNSIPKMLKNTFLLGLFCLALSACNNTETPATDTEVMVDTPQTAIPTAPEASMLKGENWEVKVVDGTIKSPRKELVAEVDGLPVVVNYGSPAVNDRVIYGDLVPFRKVWRTGANEATRITFKEDAVVGESNKKLPAGTYALFTLPESKEEWTIIFNKVADQWGAYDYEESQDVQRIKGMAKPIDEKAERMDFTVDGNNVQLMWDDLKVAFPVAAASK